MSLPTTSVQAAMQTATQTQTPIVSQSLQVVNTQTPVAALPQQVAPPPQPIVQPQIAVTVVSHLPPVLPPPISAQSGSDHPQQNAALVQVHEIIDNVKAVNMEDEEEGDDLPENLATALNNMCWHIYSENEVNGVYKCTLPPENVERLHTVDLNSRIEDYMVSYGKSLQTNLAKIQKPMQRALVPIACLIHTAMKGETTPPDELVEELVLAASLGAVAISRTTRTCRDITHDALPHKYKCLASKKWPVASGKLFGPDVEIEYKKLMEDAHDAFYINHITELDKPVLDYLGKAGALPPKDPRSAKKQGNNNNNKQSNSGGGRCQHYQDNNNSGNYNNNNYHNNNYNRDSYNRDNRDYRDNYYPRRGDYQQPQQQQRRGDRRWEQDRQWDNWDRRDRY